MQLDEAVKAIGMNLRSTCMILESVRNDQVDKAIESDWLPMQDHLALSVRDSIYEGSSVKDCLNYLEQMHDGLSQALAHYKMGSTKVGCQKEDVMYMVDMLYGYIGHQFEDNYVECARECIKAYDETPIDPDEEINTENAAIWRGKVLAKFNAILKKHHIDISESTGFDIRYGYLIEWLNRKYWK